MQKIQFYFSFLFKAYAIHCYICNSADQPDCNDPFDAKKTYATNCVTQEYSMLKWEGCLKMELKVGGKWIQ